MSREFVSWEIFVNTVYNNLEYIDKETTTQLSLGYDYLYSCEVEEFINIAPEDGINIDSHQAISDVGRLLLEGLVEHFCCELALELLDKTDIDQLNLDNIKIEDIRRYSVTIRTS